MAPNTVAKKVKTLTSTAKTSGSGRSAKRPADRVQPKRGPRKVGLPVMPDLIGGAIGFRVLKHEVIKADDRGRLTIGDPASAKQFRVLINDSGQILLDPVVVMSERELWLYKNPTALASVMQGLREAADGEVHDLGSFADLA
jgi:hypothetical protein